MVGHVASGGWPSFASLFGLTTALTIPSTLWGVDLNSEKLISVILMIIPPTSLLYVAITTAQQESSTRLWAMVIYLSLTLLTSLWPTVSQWLLLNSGLVVSPTFRRRYQEWEAAARPTESTLKTKITLAWLLPLLLATLYSPMANGLAHILSNDTGTQPEALSITSALICAGTVTTALGSLMVQLLASATAVQHYRKLDQNPQWIREFEDDFNRVKEREANQVDEALPSSLVVNLPRQSPSKNVGANNAEDLRMPFFRPTSGIYSFPARIKAAGFLPFVVGSLWGLVAVSSWSDWILWNLQAVVVVAFLRTLWNSWSRLEDMDKHFSGQLRYEKYKQKILEQ
eukprot:scaffold34609_cov146-Amphora_coffeaeformis.AAC.20